MPEAPLASVRCNARLGALVLEVEFSLRSGWTVLFGPSASGTSSVLRLIAGLWRPENASVQLGEDDLTRTPPHRRRVGLVAQQPALFPHLDVWGNVRFGGAGESAAETLQLLGLEHLRHAPIAQLSGGERQRVALARALAAAPRLLLLDEVFTGMHREQRTDLLQRVRSHCSRHGIPVLSVTHDVAEAFASADEVLRMQEGRIVAQGSPADVLKDERTELVRQLSR